MKIYGHRINHKHHTIQLIIVAFFLSGLPSLAGADSFVQLKGYWQCQEDGVGSTIEFKSREQLVYNGQAAHYQISPGVLQVMEAHGTANYFYKLEGENLLILSPDGAITQCRKAKKPTHKEARQTSDENVSPGAQSQPQGQHWPPAYVRPQGRVDEVNPGAQALLYKFAGRWDHVTRNTLTNLFLKPDGTYEEAYEAGYSGVFKDQGGYQTGNWGATGAQQSRGRWKVVGGLREGRLYLVDQNGREAVIAYQVHIKEGEVFWGEYFFDGKLHSVAYIYR